MSRSRYAEQGKDQTAIQRLTLDPSPTHTQSRPTTRGSDKPLRTCPNENEQTQHNQFPCSRTSFSIHTEPHHKTSNPCSSTQKKSDHVYIIILSPQLPSQRRKNPHCPPSSFRSSKIPNPKFEFKISRPGKKKRGKGLETSKPRDFEMIGLD